MNRLVLFVLLTILTAWNSLALAGKSAHEPGKIHPAVVLAVFGSTNPQGMAGAEKLKQKLEARFPGVPVRVGLTSRHAITTLKAPGVLTVMAQLADEGYRGIVLEPLHVSAGAEYEDLRALADVLNALARTGINKPPFGKIVLGQPLLGAPMRSGGSGTEPGGSMRGNTLAIRELARTLAADAAEAKAGGSALVYGGHGNPKWPAREVFAFQTAMTTTYPGVTVLAGTMESKPGLADVLAAAKKSGKRSVLLYPLLFGAGVHAADDLCGDGKDSWKTAFKDAGFTVDCRMRGLGEADAVTDMLARRVGTSLKQLGYKP